MGTGRDAVEAAKDLVLEFWACMDETSDGSAEALFTEDGVLTIDPIKSAVVRVAGLEQLAVFCRKRREVAASSKRVTRHVVSNQRVVAQAAESMTLSGYVTDYIGAGELPLPVLAPTAVADFSYDFVLNADGAWRLSLVSGKIIFEGQH